MTDSTRSSHGEAQDEKPIITDYMYQRLVSAFKTIQQIADISVSMIPLDGYLSPKRAAVVREAWLRMREEIQNIEIELAKELKEVKDRRVDGYVL